MVRHAIESYKESQDHKFLENDNDISIRGLCEKYGRFIVDEVVIQRSL
jgi:hypothetical protein